MTRCRWALRPVHRTGVGDHPGAGALHLGRRQRVSHADGPPEESRIVSAIEARFAMSEEAARELAGTVLESQTFDPRQGIPNLRWPAEPGSR